RSICRTTPGGDRRSARLAHAGRYRKRRTVARAVGRSLGRILRILRRLLERHVEAIDVEGSFEDAEPDPVEPSAARASGPGTVGPPVRIDVILEHADRRESTARHEFLG